jgi:hypothetical protein
MMHRRAARWLSGIASATLVFAGTAAAQKDTTARSTGLPKQVQWKFNFDAGLGAFGFGNSLYTQAHPDPSGNLGDDWIESYAKPALSAVYPLRTGSVYGAASVVGERTFAAPPSVVGEDASSFQVEDLYIGWRSGKALSIGDDAVDVQVGRMPYTIGRGFLIQDGGGEGGSRGGYWSNARKAWEFAEVITFKPKHHTFQVFYLDRAEVPETRTGTRLWGANYDLAWGEANTVGATFIGAMSDSVPNRDGMSVVNLRAYVSPFKRLPFLSVGAEYANESNGTKLTSNAWMAEAAYEFASVAGKPKVSYRYAFYQGDDPSTEKSEAFDPLFPGFYDWGTWWQGEIAGEYFLSNSNLASHQARVHFTPTESLGTGLIGYLFRNDHPESFGPGVTSKNIASEVDAYTDWKVNRNFSLSFILAYGNPQEALAQGYQRTQNFTYGMAYVTYSY